MVAIQQLPTASEELPRRAPCNLAPLHRDLAPIPAWQVPVVAMATLVDPILPAIERDRIAYVAFALLNKTDGRKGSTEKRSRSASPGSFEAALRSAGGAIFAVDAARVAYPDYERENGTKWPDRHLDPTEARLFAFAALRALGWSGF